MSLSVYEVFDNVEELSHNVKGAVTTNSDGGKQITRTEAVNIAIKFLEKFGVDVIDKKDEPDID